MRYGVLAVNIDRAHVIYMSNNVSESLTFRSLVRVWVHVIGALAAEG